MGVASIAVKGGATAMKVAKGAMYVARAADLASNAYAFCVGAHDTGEQIRTIQQKLYNGESVSADEYGRMVLSAICTVISGASTAISLKGFGTVDDDLALLASKYKKVAPEIDNPTTTKMTGGVDKTPDVEIKSKSSEPSLKMDLQRFAKKADDAYQIGSVKSCGSSVQNKTKILKFADNDFVYGPSAGGKLRELQEKAGGKLVSDLGDSFYMNGYTDWFTFSKHCMEDTVRRGNRIHFDLTYMQDVNGILNGTSQYSNTITSKELTYIYNNWDRFFNNVKFYNNGMEVLPPWKK